MIAIKNLLGVPVLYNGMQKITGAMKARKTVINEYLRPTKGNMILDIGCGTGYIIDYLPECRYVGFDINADYIEYARHRYGHRGEFYQQNVTQDLLKSFGMFDCVMMNGLIHHLEDTQAKDLLRIAKSVLKSGGIVAGIDGCYKEKLSPVELWMLKNDRGEYVRNHAGYEAIFQAVFSDTILEMRNELFLVPYSCLVWKCTNS